MIYFIWTYVTLYLFLLAIGVTMLVADTPWLIEIGIVLSSWSATFVFIMMFRRIYPNTKFLVFLKSLFKNRVRLSLILIIIGIQSSLLIGVLVSVYLIWDVPIYEQVVSSGPALLLLFAYNLILGPLGEEIGWRGFVLNELQKKHSPLMSALLIGIVWGFWHTPLWFMSGYSGMALMQYCLSFLSGIIAVSIIITACYNLSNNLTVPILIHQLFNFSLAIQIGDILPILTVTSVLYVVTAVLFVLVNYKKCLLK